MNFLYKVIIGILIVVFIVSLFYIYEVFKINNTYYKEYNIDEIVAIRKFPYPYRAALSICSDIDQTDSVEEFLKIQLFLNTKNNTPMGPGVGLEIGNSFFMLDDLNRFNYFSWKEFDKEIIIKFINSGILDCLHSYGVKKDFSRRDALHCITELKSFEKRIDVWIDHSDLIDNIGQDLKLAEGDVKESSAYHADLTVKYGVKYFWLGRVSSIIGQERPIGLENFLEINDTKHIFFSFINIMKEFSKHFLAIFGNEKYLMHNDLSLVDIKTLRDGQKIYEFIRCDPHWRGIGKGGNSKGLAYALSKNNLHNLINNHGYMIVYTHLGKNSDCNNLIAFKTQNALRNLAKENKNGNIYVTTTSKLLNYYINRKNIKVHWKVVSDSTYIHIKSIYDPISNSSFLPTINDLHGITFYVPDTNKISIYIGAKKVIKFKKNKEDYTGRKSIMFPIKKMELNTNYLFTDKF